MKLSFSTNKWQNFKIDDFIKIATEYKFDGIEVHNIDEISKDNLSETYHSLIEYGIKIPCIDMVSDVSVDSEDLYKEFDRMKDIISKLHIPYVRLKSTSDATKFISNTLPYAKENNITFLVETVGEYADTSKLRDLLEKFADDNLAALWDFHYPYWEKGETPEDTIKNLGAYVKHIHIKDSESLSQHSLMGEGNLPIDKFINALRSINYDGFVSIEWDPNWVNEVDDIDIIFPHFVSFMSRYQDPSKAKKVLYNNKTY